MKEGVEWYALDPRMVSAHVLGLDNTERLRFFDSMLRGLLLESRGKNPVADKMIQEREYFLARSAEGGRKGAQARWPGKHPPNTLRTPPVDSPRPPLTPPVDSPDSPQTPLPDTDTDITPTETKTKTGDPDTRAGERATAQDGETGSGSGRPALKDEVCETAGTETTPFATPLLPGVDAFKRSPQKARCIMQLPPEKVIVCMIWYCTETNPKAAKRGLQKELKRLGKETFKNVCANFVAGIDSGNDPEPVNRGAALMARLKDTPSGSGL